MGIPLDAANLPAGVGTARLGSARRPRPAGRAGCVTMPTVSWVLASSASSTVAAKSGLPQKTTRMRTVTGLSGIAACLGSPHVMNLYHVNPRVRRFHRKNVMGLSKERLIVNRTNT